MLPLPLLLLAALPQGAGSQDAAPVCAHCRFRIIQISSFANSSWVRNDASAWLGHLQTHSWDSGAGSIRFLQAWSRGNFSAAELTELEDLFRVFFIGFAREVQDRVGEFGFEYPFVIQSSVGCEVLSGKPGPRFLRAAFGGLDFLSLQNASCVPAPEGGWKAQRVCSTVLQYKGICDTVRKLLVNTCPRFLLGLLHAGQAELQRQVRPEAWLSPGPSPGPGRLLLVCHVSGFYPEPLWATWVRGQQEQPGVRRGDTLPNADGTWYLRVTLDVAAGEAAGLACRVKHSSLGGHDVILPWGLPTSSGWAVWATVVPALALLSGLALWALKRRAYQTIP